MTHPSGWSAGSHVCKISQCRLEVSPATTLEELTLEKCRAGSVLGLIASNGRVQAFMNYHVPSHGGCPFNFGRGSNSFIDNNVDMRSTVEEAFPQQCGISSGGKRGLVICFRGLSSRILNDKCYEDCLNSQRDERKRIFEAAAIITIKSICTGWYDCDTYPSPEVMVEGGCEMIPENLHSLLREVRPSGRHPGDCHEEALCQDNRTRNNPQEERRCLLSNVQTREVATKAG
uniref:Uncharacterized protein n=1 Tax=Timema bartmani TaxID=61472 RepID=A0A7R9FAY1_9NEOP|nr:unnamed protein product [Timema bartmani]